MAAILQSDPLELHDVQAGPMLEAVVQATERTHDLLGPTSIQQTVDAMVARAHALGASQLHGASDAGFFLAGAMAQRSNLFRLWRPGDQGPVLLVDGVLAGLVGLYVTASHVQAVGAEPAGALFLGLIKPGQESNGVRPTHLSLSDAA
jgi:hypothetical protein